MSRTFYDRVQAGNILNRLWQRCETEESCDILLIAGTERKRIPAHRSILSVTSEYFDRVLDENSTKEIEMPSFSGDILQRVIEYCYTGRIALSQDIAVELLKTAHKLFLNNLVGACEKFLVDQLHTSNCFGFALIAERYHCQMLLEKARDFCLKELLKMYGTDQFLDLRVEQVSQLLASDDLCVESEEDVFNSLMKWIEHDQSEREQLKADLLKLVRLPLLERSFLINKVKPICTSIECLQIYTEALEWHLSSEINVRVFSENKLMTSRRLDMRMIGISLSESDNKMFIHYYCPQRKKWMKWLRELEYRAECGIAVLGDDIFIIGGWDANDIILSTVVCLNLRTMTLKETPAMQEQRACCRAAVLNGFLYAIGGCNGKTQLSSVEKFDPKSNKWEAVASMSVKRCSTGVASLNQKLYVIGGWSSGSALCSAECYDPIQNVWQRIASMGESRQLHGLAISNGLLYAVGGHQRKTVERYDPQTNKWSVMCSLSQEMHSVSYCCASLRNKVVVCCNDHIEVYNSATNEWKQIVSLKNFNIDMIFSYSDKLLTTEFI